MNNREIKFRAWDLSSKKYKYPKLWDNSMPSNWDKHYILEQFIDLKDKNGNEIYSGDILKDSKGRFYKVFPVRGGFAINIHADDFHKESAPFYESTADQQTSGFISGNCEIIGNIHQNPELLNK